ncbi:MAG: thiamine-phosphate kinase [Candidatus Curtissbacteria bacterium]|nr:thiamine-phosphate kinase [Candidatus Curtissbacteria bacterium]
MNEREFVDSLRKRFEKPPGLVSDWMGDDCEVIDIGDPENYLLLTVDTSSEMVDFPQNAPPFEVGYFCAALSLSDIAACGGNPTGVLVSCSVSREYIEEMQQIYTGIEKAVNDAGTVILGGDTNSAGEFSLSVVSIGKVKKENVLMRRRAGVDDVVAVTGYLDRFNYGYRQYENNVSVGFRNMLRQPAPIEAGKVLAAVGGVTSCTDLPDGLVKTLYDNSPSGLGYLINDKDIPIQNKRSGVANFMLASRPAGDIQLLFTFERSSLEAIERAFSERRLSLQVIGVVTDSPGVRVNTPQGLLDVSVDIGFTHKFDDYKLFT